MKVLAIPPNKAGCLPGPPLSAKGNEILQVLSSTAVDPLEGIGVHAPGWGGWMTWRAGTPVKAVSHKRRRDDLSLLLIYLQYSRMPAGRIPETKGGGIRTIRLLAHTVFVLLPRRESTTIRRRQRVKMGA